MSSPDLDLEKRLAALRDLLRGLFDGEQLRRFLVTLPGGSQLSDELPGVNASFAALFHETTLLLHRWRLVDGELFNALVRARPTALSEIERVAALWSLGVTTRVRLRGAPSLVGADDPSERAANELRELRNKLSVLKSRGLPTAALEQAIREKARALQAGRSIAVGDTLAEGRYLVVEKLGSGGFATVWRAWDDVKQREVAIKALKGELAGERSRLERFQRGARLMAGLVHPHIVRVYDEARVEGGLHYVVMELLGGGDLHQRVLAGTYDRDAALQAVLGIGDALAFAHSKGVVHRDVKPHNILIDEGGGAKLTDFDLGRAEDGTRDTRTASSMGTLMYAAPESLGNAREVGPEGDIASLAMTAAFCIHGADLPPESLYQRDRFFALLDCHDAVRAVLIRASAHRPQDRYSSAGAFCEALKAALGAPPAPALLVASPGASVEAPVAPRVSGSGWTPPVAQVPEPSTTTPPVVSVVSIAPPVASEAPVPPAHPASPVAHPALRPPIAQVPPVVAPAPAPSVSSLHDLPRPTPRKTPSSDEVAQAVRSTPAWAIEPMPLESDGAAQRRRKRLMIAGLGGLGALVAAGIGALALRQPDPGVDENPKENVLNAVEPEPLSAPGPTGRRWVGENGGLPYLELAVGRFQMGSADGLGETDERPSHAVQVSGFLLAQAEVTQGLWLHVVKSPAVSTGPDAASLPKLPSKFSGKDLPVESVSWCDAVRFANALSTFDGLTPVYKVGADCEQGGAVQWDQSAIGYRLPTEAEWEYAARAGTSTMYTTGDTEADLARMAWYAGNSGGTTHDVCTASEKPWGFCDLLGNVSEWVWDWKGAYSTQSAVDPRGPDTGDSRMIRGGSWYDPASRARPAYRYWNGPERTNAVRGFRLALPASAMATGKGRITPGGGGGP